MGSSREKGFTRVEWAVLLVLTLVIAFFAIPRYRDSVERVKAEEAFNYLAAVRSAQERYLAHEGIYANAVSLLDIHIQSGDQGVGLTFFDAGPVKDDTTEALGGGDHSPFENGWRLALTRKPGAYGYGQYTVCFNQDGFIHEPKFSTIVKYPAINPMATVDNGRKDPSH